MTILQDAEATEVFGRSIASTLRVGDVVLLDGDLGAGKTTLARGILAGLGLAGEAPSPTFAIVQPYAPPETTIPVWHIDLYRIDDAEDVHELGLDEALEDAVLLIEWPDRLPHGWWPGALRIALIPEGGYRRLTATVPPSWKDRWPHPTEA